MDIFCLYVILALSPYVTISKQSLDISEGNKQQKLEIFHIAGRLQQGHKVKYIASKLPSNCT
jgi:hypothetical protein